MARLERCQVAELSFGKGAMLFTNLDLAAHEVGSSCGYQQAAHHEPNEAPTCICALNFVESEVSDHGTEAVDAGWNAHPDPCVSFFARLDLNANLQYARGSRRA
jgi:hypothetical protein